MKVKPTAFLRAQYKLVRDSYTGQGGYANGAYLWKHDSEWNFENRKTMGVYTNYMQSIVDVRVDPVFITEPTRVMSDDPILEAFLENADNNNTPLTEIIHGSTTDTTLMGNDFIIMDSFPENSIPDNMAEVIEQRRFPYVYTKGLLDVYSSEVDIFGKLKEIVFYFGLYEGAKEGQEIYLYKKYTPTDIFHFTKIKDDNGAEHINVISEAKHNLGVVPVIYHNKKITPYSPYYSMSTLARKTYNTDSQLTNLERTQSFSILLMPSTFTGNEAKDNMVISTHNAIFFDAQAQNKPEYIAPDANVMKVLMDKLDQSFDRLIQSADVLGTTAIANGNSATSGKAEQFKFFGKQNALLASSKIADYLDSNVIEMLGKFSGTEYEYLVEYNTNFNPTFTDTNQQILVLERISDREISDLVTAKVNAAMIEMIAPFVGWDDEELSDMLESITEVNEIL